MKKSLIPFIKRFLYSEACTSSSAHLASLFGIYLWSDMASDIKEWSQLQTFFFFKRYLP